ncbi:hypothetical protein F511_07537 [Dorcoceras hygrometricum]|uniref:Uncharacterized protein n=1 Tax=Dorcoceras hygrometricum TaxID=472368 RepID=A0A2Z7B5W5_9LAMI|nr:hypothetical protein F511_07537 [Dorcoceras hygrometricum]
MRRLGRALVAASRELLRTLAAFLYTAAHHDRRMLALSCDDGRPKHAAGLRAGWRTTSTWSAALVAAARAPLHRAIFMAAPPAGRRSGESPAMS